MSQTGTETSTATEDRKGDWIQTGVTKRKFWPLDARPEEVDVRDIAHALSNLCRFTGHTSDFYSVAQHSVMASLHVPEPAALAALLHDAAEAYMGDIARPWKRFLYIRTGAFVGRLYESFRDVEHELLAVILNAFGAPPMTDRAVWDHVDRIDETLLVTEARDLMAPLADGWRHSEANGYAALPVKIVPLSPADARAAFLDRYYQLQSRKFYRATRLES